MFAIALSLAAAVSLAVQQPAAEARLVVPSADAQWQEVDGEPPLRGFVDRASIRVQNGRVRYVGHTVLPEPDEYGVIELFHVGEIDCAAGEWRVVAFDALGAEGQLLGAFEPPEAESREAITPGSPNDTLRAEFCR